MGLFGYAVLRVVAVVVSFMLFVSAVVAWFYLWVGFVFWFGGWIIWCLFISCFDFACGLCVFGFVGFVWHVDWFSLVGLVLIYVGC